jgi:hypothetical protein
MTKDKCDYCGKEAECEAYGKNICLNCLFHSKEYEKYYDDVILDVKNNFKKS